MKKSLLFLRIALVCSLFASLAFYIVAIIQLIGHTGWTGIYLVVATAALCVANLLQLRLKRLLEKEKK